MAKIVVLNSGGFDSIVLIHYLYNILGEKDLYSLHFKYGENNEIQQLECVDRVCKKFNIPNKVIKLPPMNWTQSNFFTDSEYVGENQYLEWRNLIFLSYAMSYAEAIKADSIYLALLNIADYKDTTPEFIEKMNYVGNIPIIAPFINDNKNRLGHIAKYLKISPEEYFSCDKPTKDGKPCGECPDCKALYDIFN